MHPEVIDGEWLRVDHPVLDPLRFGEPTLGWEGDPRLVVYLYGPTRQFTLWRLEDDGQYRPVGHLPAGASLTPESVNQAIRWLISIDTRRGFDPYEYAVESSEAREREVARTYRDRLAHMADRLLFALSRAHIPGVHVVRKVFIHR